MPDHLNLFKYEKKRPKPILEKRGTYEDEEGSSYYCEQAIVEDASVGGWSDENAVEGDDAAL